QTLCANKQFLLLLFHAPLVVSTWRSFRSGQEETERGKKKIKTRCSKFHADLRFSWATSARLLARLLRTTGRNGDWKTVKGINLQGRAKIALTLTLCKNT
ncbi:hypothetical protein MGG_16763, partial [Pyricularia oryzae 70-15]